MMKAITISRQNDAENLVLLVALVLESKGRGWLGLAVSDDDGRVLWSYFNE